MVWWEMLDEERLISIKCQGMVVWKEHKRKKKLLEKEQMRKELKEEQI